MSMLVLQAGVFLAAVLFTAALKNLALRLRFLDRPGARSAHSNPTPFGGGIVIVILFLAVSAYAYNQNQIPGREFLALAGALLVALTGLVDDLADLDIHWRVPIQFLAAIWVVWCLGDVPAIDFGVFLLSSGLLLNVLAVLALVWLLNLYNFMDGIDGIAASELLFVSLMSLLFAIKGGDEVVTLLTATLLSAGAGFLVWNWPPAKIFMGDVGSLFIGFTLGILALLTMHSGSMTVWTWVILLGIFIVDATLTLARRFAGKQKWYEGHASHAYQNAARQWRSHARVTITVIAINCLWLAPLAWLSVQSPRYGFFLSLLAITPLCFLAVKLKAGQLMEASSSGSRF